MPENQLASVRRKRAELDLAVFAVLRGRAQTFDDPITVVGVDDLLPLLGRAEPASERMSENVASALRNETDDEGCGIRFPQERIQEVDEAFECSVPVGGGRPAPDPRRPRCPRDVSKPRTR